MNVAHIIKVLRCSVFVICSNEKVKGCCEGNGASETRKEAGVRQNEATNSHNRPANFRPNISPNLHVCLLQDQTDVNAIRVEVE